MRRPSPRPEGATGKFRWRSVGLTAASGLVYAAKSFPNHSTLAPNSGASTTHAEAVVAVDSDSENNWLWLGYQGHQCTCRIDYHAAGCKPTECQDIGLGVDITQVTWFSSRDTGHFPGPVFKLQTFRERGCKSSDGNFTNDATCTPATVFSWKVVPLIKDE